MFQNISSDEYAKHFNKAFSIIRKQSPFCDVHNLAHQAVELFYSGRGLDLQDCVYEILSCEIGPDGYTLFSEYSVNVYEAIDAAIDLERFISRSISDLSGAELLALANLLTEEEVCPDLAARLIFKLRKVTIHASVAKKEIQIKRNRYVTGFQHRYWKILQVQAAAFNSCSD